MYCCFYKLVIPVYILVFLVKYDTPLLSNNLYTTLVLYGLGLERYTLLKNDLCVSLVRPRSAVLIG